VFRGNDETVVTLDDTYRDLLLRDILPTVHTKCPGVRFIAIANYIEGFQINHAGEVYREAEGKVTGTAEEDPLNTVSATRRKDGSWDLNMVKFIEPLGRSEITSLKALRDWRVIEAKRERQAQTERERLAQEAREPARSAVSERVDCEKQSASSAANSGPSARDVCRAFEALVEKTAAKISAIEDLYTSFTAKKGASSFTITIVEFELKGCKLAADGKAYACDYHSRFEASGGGSGVAPILKAFAERSNHARSDFVREGENWRLRPPPPTPYSELPCCWHGDIRVRDFDCREDCH